jgi:hypothetical protein
MSSSAAVGVAQIAADVLDVGVWRNPHRVDQPVEPRADLLRRLAGDMVVRIEPIQDLVLDDPPKLVLTLGRQVLRLRGS